MEVDKCFTCLVTDRKLIELGDLARTFELLTWDIQVLFTNDRQRKTILLCWECRAAVRKAWKFIKQVYKVQYLLMKESKHFRNCNHTISSIQPSATCNYDLETSNYQINNNYFETFDWEIKKEEDATFVEDEVPIDYDNEIFPVEAINIQTLPVSLDIIENSNLVEHFSDVDSPAKLNCDIDIAATSAASVDVKPPKRRKIAQVNSRKSRSKKRDELNSKDKFYHSIMSDEEMQRARQEGLLQESYLKWEFRCDMCLITCLNDEKYLEHMKKHKPQPNHEKCPICTMYVPARIFPEHKRRHHYKYTCLLCDVVVYFRSRLMWRHYWSAHATHNNLSCGECNEVFATVYLYKMHYRTTHQKSIKCRKCNVSFIKQHNYEKHMQQHRLNKDTEPLKCKTCNKTFKYKASLKHHVANVHEPRPQNDAAFCAECGVHFKTIVTYKAHLKTTLKHADKDDPKFFCDYCGKCFLKKHLLQVHIKVMHIPERYKCNYCEKTYSKATNARRHMLEIHEGVERPRDKICDICGKGFMLLRTLESHKRTHTGERPFQCPFCPNNFGHQAALYTHKRLVHKVAKLKHGDDVKIKKVPLPR